jgi:SNF2 family DNA or RNA helicase
VVIFTLFKATVRALMQRLAAAKINAVQITGDLELSERAESKNALNTGDARVLVCTMQSGGVGLTLTGANVGLFVDRHWNPVIQEQAVDRLHRIGQDKQVHIVDFHCPSTVDDLVDRALERKEGMIDAILEHSLIPELKRYLSV